MTTFAAAVESAQSAQLIADLKAARAELVARGRCRGVPVHPDGRVCIIGAIGAGMYEDFTGLAEEAQYNALYQDRPRRVRSALSAHLPENLHVDSWVDDEVAAFNDCRATTDQDVLDLFDKTLANLGGLA